MNAASASARIRAERQLQLAAFSKPAGPQSAQEQLDRFGCQAAGQQGALNSAIETRSPAFRKLPSSAPARNTCNRDAATAAWLTKGRRGHGGQQKASRSQPLPPLPSSSVSAP